MKNSVVISAMICCWFILSCSEPEQLPFFNDASFEPLWISPSNSSFTRIHRIADFSFLNQDSILITNKNFDGSIYVADFFFTTCPSICPKMTEHMLELQEYFKSENKVKLVSYSVTPWLDTVAQLKKYALKKGIDSRKWQLLTGSQKAIYTLARDSYFAERELGLMKGDDDFLHTENFILVDSKRRIRGIYSGTQDRDLKRIKEDIRMLLNDIKE